MLLIAVISHGVSFGQPVSASYLHPGFDGKEYRELLDYAFHGALTPDTTRAVTNDSERYTLAYRSPEVGMRNRWDLWVRKDHHVAVIVLRGTVNDKLSWLENFYAAMVPATGSVQLGDSVKFDYRLSADDKAMVHVGWLLGLAYLAPTMVEQLRRAQTGQSFLCLRFRFYYPGRLGIYRGQCGGLGPGDAVYRPNPVRSQPGEPVRSL